jgi:hypothetical protein
MVTMIRGGELAELGNGQEGIKQMCYGLATLRALGADIGSTYWVGLLTEQYGKTGQVAEGLDVLAEAFTLVNNNEERWWEAEFCRLNGELTLQQSRASLEQLQGRSKTRQNKPRIGLEKLKDAKSNVLNPKAKPKRGASKPLKLRAAST